MIYLKAPNELELDSNLNPYRSIFLAGSITGASNWQEEAGDILYPHFNIFNPRQDNYNPLNKDLELEQISWEYKYLDIANITLFYFAPETLAPITLLEYGKQLVKSKHEPWRKTYIHIHPEYKRKSDVLIQTQLAEINNHFIFDTNLADMCKAIIKQDF